MDPELIVNHINNLGVAYHASHYGDGFILYDAYEKLVTIATPSTTTENTWILSTWIVQPEPWDGEDPASFPRDLFYGREGMAAFRLYADVVRADSPAPDSTCTITDTVTERTSLNEMMAISRIDSNNPRYANESSIKNVMQYLLDTTAAIPR